VRHVIHRVVVMFSSLLMKPLRHVVAVHGCAGCGSDDIIIDLPPVIKVMKVSHMVYVKTNGCQTSKRPIYHNLLEQIKCKYSVAGTLLPSPHNNKK
jgi:hypothetical protein